MIYWRQLRASSAWKRCMKSLSKQPVAMAALMKAFAQNSNVYNAKTTRSTNRWSSWKKMLHPKFQKWHFKSRPLNRRFKNMEHRSSNPNLNLVKTRQRSKACKHVWKARAPTRIETLQTKIISKGNKTSGQKNWDELMNGVQNLEGNYHKLLLKTTNYLNKSDFWMRRFRVEIRRLHVFKSWFQVLINSRA